MHTNLDRLPTLDRFSAGDAAPDLVCALRWVQVPMLLLTLGFSAQLFWSVDTWSGLPLPIAVQASMLVAIAAVWPGRQLPRSRVFHQTIAAHAVAVIIGGWLMGQPLETTMPIAIGSLAYALTLAWLFRRHSDTWCPRDAKTTLQFFGYAYLVAPVPVLLGAVVGCPPSALVTDPVQAFVACVRIGGNTSVAIGTVLVLYFAPRAASRLIAKPLTPLIMIATVLSPLVISWAPSSPVAWMVVMGPLVAGLLMPPRWVAVVVLAMGLAGSQYYYPWYVTGELSWFPPKLFLDMLMGYVPVAATIIAIARDRNARMAAQAALDVQAEAEQGELMTAVFQSMSDGLVLCDATGRVTLSNKAADELLETSTPGTVTWPWQNDQTRRARLPACAQTCERGTTVTVPAPGDTGHRLINLRQPLPLDNANLTLHLMTDVTEERARQRELETFAGTLAHDLKGPLTAMSGWLATAADEWEAGETQTALSAARRASSASARMRMMVEDYLAYTVMRDGELTLAPVALESIAHDIAAVYEGADRAGVVFEYDAPDTVYADRSLTRQLFANLINNSVKYCRPGEAAFIHISSRPTSSPSTNGAEPAADDGDRTDRDRTAEDRTPAVNAPEPRGWVRVEVADRGVGIQPGEEQAIFGAFKRSAKDAPTHQGIGLGLSLCAQIVARHGGQITAANNEWGGATITFTLPAVTS